MNVGVLQAVSVTGSNHVPQPSAITADAARRLTAEFRIVPREMPRATVAPTVELAMRQAVDDAANAGPAHRAAGNGSGASGARKDAGIASGDKQGRDSKNDEPTTADGRGKDSANGTVEAAAASVGNGVSLVDAVMSLGPAKKSGKK